VVDLKMDYETKYLFILLRLWIKMLVARIRSKLDVNRTAFRTVSLFGQTLKAKVDWDHFPVLTTKSIYLHGVIIELIWFLKGDANIKYLLDNKVRIWTPNAYDHNKNKAGFPDITMKEYGQRIKKDKNFSEEFGSLDGGYGKAWRDFNGIDQIERSLRMLKEEPESRENIVSAWNPEDFLHMALPPCHFAFQPHVKEGELSLSMYQRSADWFLGVPFNLTSYSLLLLLLAKQSGYKPGYLYMHFGDTHLYENHFKQAITQIVRWPLKKKAPKILIDDKVKESDLKDLKESDFEIKNYNHLGKISAEMAV
jgi:thymidylate synthase